MVPIFLLFRKIIKGIYATIILIGVLAIFAIIFGLTTNWNLKKNMIFDLRAWGEMNLAMFSYYLSLYVGSQTYGKGMSIFLKIIEIICYCVPVILGVIPIKHEIHVYCMAATCIFVFFAISITLQRILLRNCRKDSMEVR